MDRTVRLRGFDITHTNYNAVCCTHCNYDMGYDHIHCRYEIGISAGEVICPECFTKQIRINPNRAPDSWYETNAASSNMADRADESDTETYEILETVTGYRSYNFEFPDDCSWDDVRYHDIDWNLQQIRIGWNDGTESTFRISDGHLDDLDETGEYRINDNGGREIVESGYR